MSAFSNRAHGGSLRRFETPKAKGSSRINLHPSHPALVDGHSIFRSRVFHASVLPRLLIGGHNAAKIGKIILKGKWKGFPVFTLTLEERDTCPRSCRQWATCYGTNMHMARRIIADEAMEARLWQELIVLNRQHPGGFVVRLHILGDFRDVTYVELWRRALDEFEGLHVFGYTAHAPDSEIGERLYEIATQRWDRFAIRFSGSGLAEYGAEVVGGGQETDLLICPAQTGKTECCATCALCWQSTRSIAFLRH